MLCYVGMATGPDVRQTRAAARLTTAACVLAGIAVIDTISELARFATDANDRLGWLRLAVGLVASVCLSAWAIVRCRATPQRPMAQPGAMLVRPARASRRRRALRWGVTVAVVAIGTVTIIGQWGTLSQAVNQLHHLDWRWVRWAIYAEVGSVLAFAWLWAGLLRAGGARPSFGSIITLTLAGNALIVSLPGGVAWSTAFSFNALHSRGVKKGLAAKMLFASTVLSILALIGLALVGVDLAGSGGPLGGMGPAMTGIAAALGLAVVVLVMWIRRSARLAGPRAWLSPLAEGFPRRALATGFGAAVSNWVLDCVCLIAAILAVGGHVPWQGVLVAYAVGQLAQNLPITPGGIGVVEGSLTLMLVAYGMHNSTALAAVLLYRLISFGLLVPVGWLAVAAIVMPGRRRHAIPAASAA